MACKTLLLDIRYFSEIFNSLFIVHFFAKNFYVFSVKPCFLKKETEKNVFLQDVLFISESFCLTGSVHRKKDEAPDSDK
ncbi:hypothetical protein EGX22_01295 [Enterococcus gallinarum]|nr:hypothetical protein EGX22_01295 [Enterococcus gallinarum]